MNRARCRVVVYSMTGYNRWYEISMLSFIAAAAYVITEGRGLLLTHYGILDLSEGLLRVNILIL